MLKCTVLCTDSTRRPHRVFPGRVFFRHLALFDELFGAMTNFFQNHFVILTNFFHDKLLLNPSAIILASISVQICSKNARASASLRSAMRFIFASISVQIRSKIARAPRFARPCALFSIRSPSRFGTNCGSFGLAVQFLRPFNFGGKIRRIW